MKKILMLASAAAMAVTVPALAEAQGKGKGAQQSSMKRNAKSTGQARTDVRARTDSRANTRGRTRTGASVDRSLDTNGNGIPDFREQRLADANANGIPDFRERRMVDTNRNGIPDFRERMIDRNRDGVDDRAQNRFGGAECPPGLAKKSPACVAPGQAKRMFNQGQRLPVNYRNFTDFDDIPVQYQSRIPGDFRTGDYRYVYRDNSIYVVDQRTRVVRSIIDLLTR